MIPQLLRKTTSNSEILETFGQGQRMTLTSDTHLTLVTHLVEYFNQHLQGVSKNVDLF